MAKVFNYTEWGIGEWAAAIGLGWVVYQAVRDNERTARRAERRESLPEGTRVVMLDDGRVIREDV